MKNIIYSLVITLLFAAAGCKNEGSTQIEMSRKNYLDKVVATLKGGKFVINDPAIIRDAWQAQLNSQQAATDLVSLEVVQGITIGDAARPYFLLLGRNAKGTVRTASPLVQEGNRLYFEQQEGENDMVCYNITCLGESCTEGCEPLLRISNGVRSLICSACPECTKVERVLE